MRITQRLQWYESGYWHNAQGFVKRSNTFNGPGYMSMNPKFYYSGSTATHTTRIRAAFRWYEDDYLIAQHTDYSGYCSA